MIEMEVSTGAHSSGRMMSAMADGQKNYTQKSPDKTECYVVVAVK